MLKFSSTHFRSLNRSRLNRPREDALVAIVLVMKWSRPKSGSIKSLLLYCDLASNFLT